MPSLKRNDFRVISKVISHTNISGSSSKNNFLFFVRFSRPAATGSSFSVHKENEEPEFVLASV
jgi:hypothetical protein